MEKPIVSIIIPTFNNRSTIRETLESVYDQTYSNIEVVIVDDGSTDGSMDDILAYIHEKPSCKLLTQLNQGPSSARNLGFENSTGTYIIFLDADDILASTYVEECINAFLSHPTLGIVYAQTHLIERQIGVFNLSDYSPTTIMHQNCFPICAMIKADIFRKIGMFDTNLRYGEDWEMWIRYTQENNRIHKIERPLFFYRKRLSKDSISDLNRLENVSDDAHLYIYNKHYSTYKAMGWDIITLINSRKENQKYKHKYYGEWYRKLAYWVMGKKPVENS